MNQLVNTHPSLDHALGLRHRLPTRTERLLDRLRQRTTLRVAVVHDEGIVASEKVKEVGYVTRDAMLSYTTLCRSADTLAGPDPVAIDNLRFFTDTARLGMGEVIVALVDTYCRESRS